MRYSFLFGLLFSFSLVQAMDSRDLIKSLDKGLALSQEMIELNEIIAWQGTLQDDGSVKVEILSTNKKSQYLSYRCSLVENEVTCGQGPQDLVITEAEKDFDEVKLASEIGLKKAKVSSRDVLSIKVWTYHDESKDKDHDHGKDTWIKVDDKNLERDIYIQCHRHGDHDHLDEIPFCHYKNESRVKGEPDFTQWSEAR